MVVGGAGLLPQVDLLPPRWGWLTNIKDIAAAKVGAGAGTQPRAQTGSTGMAMWEDQR